MKFNPIFNLLFLFVVLFSFLSLESKSQAINNNQAKVSSDTQILLNQSKKNDLDLVTEQEANLRKSEQGKFTEYENKLFGYKIFHDRNVKFQPNFNMATPKGYVVGPKDELILQVFGVAQYTYNVIVSNEGKITIPDMGVTHVGGLTIEAVKSLLTQKMSIRYSGMRGPNPNTFLQVSISNIRTIKVNMVGEISVPGSYSLPSYINVFNALFAAGGPTIKGSFREVVVYRNNNKVAEIDLYEFIVNGQISENIRLEDNDVILVRPAMNKIIVNGEFRNTGIFEVKPNETFKELLKYTAGFSDKAYREMVSVQRKGVIENQIFDLTSNNFQNLILQDGDIVTANPILEKISNRVVITGAVIRPGQYEWSKGMRLRDAVQKAGGFRGDAFLKSINVFRSKNDFTQEVINLSLIKNDSLDYANNILLEKEDAISIKSIIDLREEYFVQISGEINNTGTFPYLDSMSLYDLIMLGGGGKYSALGSYVEIARRTHRDSNKIAEIITLNDKTALLNSDTLKKVFLKPFDHVFIRKSPDYQIPISVNISGEVLFPGEYISDKKDMRISDLILRSGGFSKYAYLNGASLLRRTKSFVQMLESEKNNQNLSSLKQNINKDFLISKLESNQLLNKRLDSRISQNSSIINEDEKQNSSEKSKDFIVNDNIKSNTRISESKQIEKIQELIAIDIPTIIANPGSIDDLILKDGDILSIPQIVETIRIKGEVIFPTSVKFYENFKLKDYIKRAGGLDRKADIRKSYIIQANGKIDVVKNFLFINKSPKILPGAEIVISANKERIRNPFTFERAVSILTTSLTLIFILRSL